jgi:phosphatidylglycerol:prolipoprotein diacylglycerol transferase
VKFPTHSLFEALAYASAFRVYLWLRSQEGDPLDDIPRWWVIAAAAMGAAIGSKVLYWLENPRMTLQMLGNFDFLLGGKTIVGGLIGGLFAVEWAKRWMGITTRTGDLFALPLCVGIPIGRIGCFLTGIEDHTAGIATTLPWGVNFGDGVMRHPTQLYEVMFTIALGVFLWWKMHRVYKQGDAFRIFMASYFAFRLLCDFLKPDIRVFAGLSSIQWACVLMLLYYSRDIVRWIVCAASIQNRLTDSMRGKPDRA